MHPPFTTTTPCPPRRQTGRRWPLLAAVLVMVAVAAGCQPAADSGTPTADVPPPAATAAEAALPAGPGPTAPPTGTFPPPAQTAIAQYTALAQGTMPALGTALANATERALNPTTPTPPPPSVLEVPTGFEATVFARGLAVPSALDFGPDGWLYVADRNNNRVVVLPDADGDHEADETIVFAGDIQEAHSLAYRDGDWVVGYPRGLVHLTDHDGDGVVDDRAVVVDDYPLGGHNTRTVQFLPDGRLVVAIGSSCTACEEEDHRRAAIVAYDGPDASGEKLFATGLAGALGLSVHPDTGQLWATFAGPAVKENPPALDAVYAVREGTDYGWPACHGGRIVDPTMGSPGDCLGVEQPVVALPDAYMTPTDLLFYDGEAFPEAYHGDLSMTLYGSWRAYTPTAYRIVRVPMDGDTPAGPPVDFATGWVGSTDPNLNSTPIALTVGPDGAMYVSDVRGYIHRIAYDGSD